MHYFRYFLPILMIPFCLHAQHPWHRVTNLPQENSINALKKIPGSGKIIAVGEGSTVMITSDFGNTWDLVFNPGGLNNSASLTAVEFIDSNTGYIAGSGGMILKSTDGGYNWDLVHSTGHTADVFTDISLSNPTNAFAIGLNDLIIRTADGGETWDALYTQAGFQLLDIDFLNPDTGFIFGNSGERYLKTIDGGTNWSFVNMDLQFPGATCYDVCFPNAQLGFITCLLMDPNDYTYAFYRTQDGGATWSEVYSNWAFNTFDMDFVNDSIIMVSGFPIDGSETVVITYDGGDTWNGIHFAGSGSAIVCDTSGKAMVAGWQGVIHESDDNGLTWNLISSATMSGDVHDVYFIDENTGYLTLSYYGFEIPACTLCRTINSGDNWTGCLGLPGDDAALNFYDDNNGFIATNTPDGDWLFKTSDGGNNWSEIETENLPEFQTTNCLVFHDDTYGYLATDNHLYQTTDGGMIWTPRLGGNVTDIDLEHWPVCDASTWTGLYRSSDMGTTWQIVDGTNGEVLNDIFYADYDHAYMCGQGSCMLRSTDGGMTWEKLQVDLQHNINFKSVYFIDPLTGFAVGDGPYETMAYTEDGGNTWQAMPSISTSPLTKIIFLNDMTGLAFGKNGLILKTENGGITGIKDNVVAKDVNLDLFPNPSHDMMTVIIPNDVQQDFILKVYNDAGSLVLSKMFSGGTWRLYVDISHFNNGVYFVTLSTSNGIYSGKFIKL